MLTRAEHQQCSVLGKFFELAGDEGFDGRSFVDGFMASATAEHFFSRYDRLQWLGERYMLEEFVESSGLVPGPKPGPTNPEALFWTGYTYRWWGYQTHEAPAAIGRQAPAAQMFGVWEGYHTLSVEEAIDRLKEGGERQSSGGHACV